MATINNSTANTLISGTSDDDGNDDIYNEGDNVTINGGDGSDTVYNKGDSVKIDAGDGNNFINNSGDDYSGRGGKNVSINGGAGNDYIENDGDSVYICGGDGNDSIRNIIHEVHTNHILESIYTPNNATINAGKGNDFIYNEGHNTSINGGEGDDYIKHRWTQRDGFEYEYFRPDNATISGGQGNDTISFDELIESNIVEYNAGDGNDVITGFNETSTLSIAGSYSSQVSGSDVIVTVGDGKITLSGAASLSTLNIIGEEVQAVNTITNTQNGVSVNGTSGDDYVGNYGDNVTIDTGAGNDSVYSYGYKVTINTGVGNDTVRNHSNSVSINTGAGDTANGGAGDDYVYNDGDSVTIDTGAGDDLISLGSYASLTVIQYATGDGNDTVYGFKAGDTLKIGDGAGSYSSQVSGNDVIVTVGDGSITLRGAATLSTLNINGVEVEPVNPLIITGTEGNDTLSNSLKGATITALGGNDFVCNYSLGSNAKIDAGAGSDTVYNQYGTYVTINAGDGNDSIKSHGSGNVLLGEAGNDTLVGGGGYQTFTGGAGDDFISVNGSTWTNVINYTAGDGNDIINGFSDKCTLKIGGGTGSYSTVISDNDIIVTVGDGKITLQGAATLWSVNILGEEVQAPNFISNGEAGVLVNGTTSNDSIVNSGANVTINAFGGNDTVNNSGNRSVINLGAGDDSVSISGTYAYATVNAGTGNDTVNGDYFLFVCRRGGGRRLHQKRRVQHPRRRRRQRYNHRQRRDRRRRGQRLHQLDFFGQCSQRQGRHRRRYHLQQSILQRRHLSIRARRRQRLCQRLPSA